MLERGEWYVSREDTCIMTPINVELLDFSRSSTALFRIPTRARHYPSSIIAMDTNAAPPAKENEESV
jgi:hypothetical protein